MIEKNYNINIGGTYIRAIGITRWIELEANKPKWIA